MISRVNINRNDLTSYISLIIACMGIFGGIFFLSPNLTGNAVAEMPQGSIGYVGLTFFLIGLLSIVLYLIERKG